MDYKEYTSYIVEQLTALRDLLIVIERGGEKSPDVLYKLAIEKSQQITECVERWREEAAPETVSVPAEYAEWLDGKTTEESCSEDIAKEDIEEKTAIDPLPFDVDAVDESESETTESQVDEIETADEEVYVAPFIDEEPVPMIVVETDEEPEEIPVVDFPTEESVTEIPWDDDDEVDENAEEEFPDDEIDEQSLYNMGEPLESDDNPITVGEMMSVRRAKELRRALSLNDRFRFRRELFGNSDVKMTETLALLDTMQDYVEACQYLAEDLGWDVNEPVVEEFLALVEKHFKMQ